MSSKMQVNEEILLNTTHGRIKGRHNVSIYGDAFYSFEKVPFAQKPLGNLRFKAPIPVEPWHDVLDCTQQPLKPLQLSSTTNQVEGSEDSLYLNVYVKKLQSEKPLPVMVFIYGGGFVKGDPTRVNHSPDYFMMQDVLVVTIGYRVGALGFLSLNDPALEIPGNAGLKDQVLALKWFSANASNFNGDPNNITLFGESAGAASTHYLMLTPQTRGLFHKAILMSGNVLCPWALVPVKDMPHRLAEAHGFDGANTDAEVVAFLQNVPAEKLQNTYVLNEEDNMNDAVFGFGPVVEPYATDGCMIPRPLSQLLVEAWGNKIPVMMGGTSFEGLMYYLRVHEKPFWLEQLNSKPEHALPFELKQELSLVEQRIRGAKLLKLHFGEKEICMDNVLEYCDFITYKLFWYPILRNIRARLLHAKAPTFLYRFDFDSAEFNHDRNKCGVKGLRGAAHYDDHSYIFYGNFSWKLATETTEFRNIQRMIEIWTTFAARSNPNCCHTEGLQWSPLQNSCKLQCLDIAEQLRVIDLPELKKLKVWEEICTSK